MEDLGENTTVLSTLRSLNNFISQRVEGGSGLDVSTCAPGSLQMQYQQSMQLEERAEQIRSKSYLIQVEREKMQMEMSHKRARVELERAANTSARNYEREVDRNQELLARIRQLQEREAEAEEKMQEQLERHKLCKQSLDAASQQLQEKEDGLATASETINVLKGRVSELQWSLMDQEVQVKRLESEKQELKEQLELQLRKCQEVNQKIQELQASQEARTDQEQKIKDLEQKLCLQEQDAALVRSIKSELLRLPRMERELKRLREDNAHLREMRETNGLLTEELEGLQRRLGRQEKMQETLVDLELEKERLLAKLQSWENLDHTMGLDLRTPEDLSRFVVELQQRELALKEKNSAIASSARGLEKAQQQLQEEVRQVSSQLLEERKKRETHEALARRLQKRVLLLTKERDGMRAILGSYDSEMTQAEYSPQLTRRVREAEDMVQKVHAHSTEMEAQLTQALEELGGQKQRADMVRTQRPVEVTAHIHLTPCSDGLSPRALTQADPVHLLTPGSMMCIFGGQIFFLLIWAASVPPTLAPRQAVGVPSCARPTLPAFLGLPDAGLWFVFIFLCPGEVTEGRFSLSVPGDRRTSESDRRNHLFCFAKCHGHLPVPTLTSMCQVHWLGEPCCVRLLLVPQSNPVRDMSVTSALQKRTLGPESFSSFPGPQSCRGGLL
ncbi:mitotic spindle assembly checkpoint protein MAD1-like isoform X1 [Ictidomys tridecemlineatus]